MKLIGNFELFVIYVANNANGTEDKGDCSSKYLTMKPEGKVKMRC